jgi:hypothetical protein
MSREFETWMLLVGADSVISGAQRIMVKFLEPGCDDIQTESEFVESMLNLLDGEDTVALKEKIERHLGVNND